MSPARDADGRFERMENSRRYPRSVRLTAEEDQILIRRATEAGLSVSDYLRIRALGPAGRKMAVHRNPEYVDAMLGKIRTAWLDSPWLALGQLLEAVCSRPVGSITDDVLADELDEWLDTSQTWSPR